MVKIGILTYHNNKNRGAILQAYSLWKSLKKKIKNSKVEIIDYRTRQKEIKRLYSLNPKVLIRNLLDFNTCANFLEDKDALSSYWIITDNHKKAVELLKKKNYDVLVVGSDEVWSYIKNESKRPFPNAYFLDPSINALKVSYGASANKMKLESLSKTELKIYKKYISSFDKISVRDEHTEKLLEELGISEIQRVPDPTILIDFPQKDLKEILLSNGVSLDRPILAINQLNKDIGKPIVSHYKKKGYQIVAPNKSSLADVDLFRKVNPLEYYSLHKYFDFVISGSLHTSIFSIKNNTPFATLDFSSKDLIDKKESLLEEFSLSDRYIKVVNQNTENILNKIEKGEKELDKKHVQKKINSMKQKGYSYIQELEEMLNEKDVR